MDYHVWITSSATHAMAHVTEGLKELDQYSLIDVGIRNGMLIVSISGSPNHAGQMSIILKDIALVCSLSEDAFGCLLFHNNDAAEHPNDFRARWITRSRLGDEETIEGLSPVIPTIEDPL